MGTNHRGRAKGVPNRITTQVRDMVMEAIDNAGGVEYFDWAAKNEPKAFLALAGKCIPQMIDAKIDIDHKFTLRDFTSLGDPNAQQKEPEVPVFEVESTRIEPGTREEVQPIPIEAVDRGSIPVAVQSEGSESPETHGE